MTAPRPVFFSAGRDEVRRSIADAAAVAVRAAARNAKSAVERLDAIDGDDPVRAHSEADEVLLSVVPPDVREAYDRLAGRCSWWASA